jgi:hypothetical protein
MPWDGSGNYTSVVDFVADYNAGPPSSAISASKMMSVLNDLGSMLTNSLARDGQNKPSADIDWNGKRLKNLGAATAPTDAIQATQVANVASYYCGSTTGSANAYAVTNSLQSSLVTGTTIRAKANFSNTGACTLNYNSGGAISIKLADGSTDPSANHITSGRYYTFTYDGTVWRLMDPSYGYTFCNSFNGRTGAITLTSTDVTTALGYAVVQNGTGTLQFVNNLKMGWDGTSRLRIQVDTTDFGTTWPINIVGNAGSASALAATSIATHAVGTINTQAIQESFAWATGNPRWKFVLEADGGWSLFNYDASGGNATQALNLSTNGGSNTALLFGQSLLTNISNIVKTSGTFATTSGAAIDITGFPAGVKRVTVNLNAVGITNGAGSFLLRMGTSGGFVTTGYVSTGGYFNNANGTAMTNSTGGFISKVLEAAGDTVSGQIVLTLEDVTNNIWSCSGVFLKNTTILAFTAGKVALGGVFDRIRLTTTVADVFNAGSFSAFYEI